MKKFLNFKKAQIQWTRKKIIIASVSLFLVIVLLITAIAIGASSKSEYVYKESKVYYGNLTVGVTESGTVDIGTIEQTFDLDMSALQRVETGNTSSGSGFGSSNRTSSGGMSAAMPSMGGGMTPMGGSSSGGTQASGGFNMFNQMFGGGGNVTSSGDATTLTVGEVLVSVGQKVSEGDPIYQLAEEEVTELQQELQDNVGKAQADLDAVYAEQKLSKKTAQNTYDISMAYGDYAQTEYNNTIRTLEKNVESSKATLEKAQTNLTEYQTRLADITESYEDAMIALDNFKYARGTADPLDVYIYIYHHNNLKTGEQQVSSLEQQKEQLEKYVEQAEENLKLAEQNYAKALRNLEQGKLEAKQTLALRNLAYNTAKETYDVTLAYLEDDTATQEEIYREAQEKWDEFSSYIRDNAVLAGYNGVITSVELQEGDSISTGTALITLYDMDDVTMTVSVYEEDMTDITVGSKVSVDFTAYPENLFEAAVTEISDASTDSKGNVLYDVTVTLKGDVSGLFQGMTGDVTFITEQSEEALYVSKRAVITENNKTYVKIKEEDGDIVKQKVTTGFSDGTYIQITEGLQEGDIVLIGSKVNK